MSAAEARERTADPLSRSCEGAARQSLLSSVEQDEERAVVACGCAHVKREHPGLRVGTVTRTGRLDSDLPERAICVQVRLNVLRVERQAVEAVGPRRRV